MWLHVIVEKRTPLDSKHLHLFQITGFSMYFNIPAVLVLSYHTKLITACCYTVMHSDSGVAIFEEYLLTNTMLTKPDTDSSR